MNISLSTVATDQMSGVNFISRDLEVNDSLLLRTLLNLSWKDQLLDIALVSGSVARRLGGPGSHERDENLFDGLLALSVVEINSESHVFIQVVLIAFKRDSQSTDRLLLSEQARVNLSLGLESQVSAGSDNHVLVEGQDLTLATEH